MGGINAGRTVPVWRSLRPAGLTSKLEDKLRRAAQAITAASGLLGLNSIDFLVDGNEYTLIEINPRPGATLDIFDDRDGSLFRAHVDSCLGASPCGCLNSGCGGGRDCLCAA